MSNLTVMASPNVRSLIPSTSLASRINWRLAGKISLIAIAVFLLAATAYCFSIRNTLKNELTPTQRLNSEPLTDQRLDEWLASARRYLWPQDRFQHPGYTNEWSDKRNGYSREGFTDIAIYPEEGSTDSLKPESQTREDRSESTYQDIEMRLRSPECRANPQRYWDTWRLERGSMEVYLQEDRSAGCFSYALGFRSSPNAHDQMMVRSRQPQDPTRPIMDAYLRIFVRKIFGMS